MKFHSSFSSFALAAALFAGGLLSSSKAVAEPLEAAASPAQDAAQDGAAASNLSGNWQISWTGRRGNQMQGTLQIKVNGSSLSGTFQAAQGSAPISGSLQGSQISFSVKMRKRQATFSGTVNGDKMSGTTQQGSPWSATRQ